VEPRERDDRFVPISSQPTGRTTDARRTCRRVQPSELDRPASYTVQLVRRAEELEAAQRLRYRVFGRELGARLGAAADEKEQDYDRFDPYCDHLVVIHRPTGNVAGTYRMLPATRTRDVGGFYSESEFDLDRLAGIAPHAVELGRAAVHPAHRNGAVITLLWSGLLNYIYAHQFRYVLGCASIPMGRAPEQAAALCGDLLQQYLVNAEWWVFPRRPLHIPSDPGVARAALPSLLKGYLRLGALIGGAPARDDEFGVADLFLILPIDCIPTRYAMRLTRFMHGMETKVSS